MRLNLGESALLPQPPSFVRKKNYEFREVLGRGTYGKVLVGKVHTSWFSVQCGASVTPIYRTRRLVERVYRALERDVGPRDIFISRGRTLLFFLDFFLVQERKLVGLCE